MTELLPRLRTAALPARAWLRAHQTGLLIAALLIAFGLLLWASAPLPDVHPPLSVDLAFDSLIALRQAMLNPAPNSESILAGIGAAAWLIIWLRAWRIRRIDAAISASIVTGCALLALQAQVYVQRSQADAAAILYLVAAVVFLVWLIATRGHAPSSASLSRRAETVLLTMILVVAVFGRLHDIKRLPYGIDGDESKWTIEVVARMVDGSDWLGSEYHRRYLPMSFWMEAPFHWVMGAGVTPARVEVAVVSVIATFIFYRLARELFDAPVALVATLLLAVSLADLTASRVANVEAHAKLWTILSMYGLTVSLRTRQVRHWLWTGAAVAGAMLTYETLMPVVAAVFTIAIGAAWHERHNWRAWLRHVAALATVPAAVTVVTIDYLLGRMQYYQDYRSIAASYSIGDQLMRGVQGLLEMFSAQSKVDWLYYRHGPYLNGLLVPLLLLGLLLALVRVRRRGYAVPLAWCAWVFIPIPIILHTPLPRILYPGLPVLYLFIAAALVEIGRAVGRAIRLPKVALAMSVAGLGAFALLNLTIWFQEVTDPDDELRRREVAEVVSASIEPGSVLLMPYVVPGEAVDVERELMALIIRERHGAPPGDYRALAYRDLLPTLAQVGATTPRAKVLVDVTQSILRDERQTILDAFQRCYTPDWSVTQYFELASVAPGALQQPNCRSAYLSVSWGQMASLADGDAAPFTFSWSLDTAPATRSELTCARSRSALIWIEPETFGELVGWISDVRFVTEFSGSGYLADDPGSEYAAHTSDVPSPGVYQVWIRSLRRQPDIFPASIEIGGQSFVFADAGRDALGEWQWKWLGDLTLDAGPLPIRLTRPFDADSERFMALFVDAIVLAADPTFDPTRDDRWEPVLQLPGPDAAARGGAFEVRIGPGQYRCQITVGDGERLIDETGHAGLVSDPMYFEVQP
jgi:hypothetical protein